MERISLGFKILKENIWLGFIPLCLNLFIYLIEISTKKLPLVPSGIHLKFAMPNSIPEMSGILQQPQTSGFNIDLSIIALFIAPFLVGGFLTSIINLYQEQQVTKDTFVENCIYFFARLLGANILTFLLMIVTFLPAFIFPPFVIISLVIILYYTYFWQLALVTEDLQIMDALVVGKDLLKANLSQVARLLIPIALLSAVISLPLNILGQNPLGYLLAIFIWSFVGTIFAIATISLFVDLAKNPEL